jgi:hypothetical protein
MTDWIEVIGRVVPSHMGAGPVVGVSASASVDGVPRTVRVRRPPLISRHTMGMMER